MNWHAKPLTKREVEVSSWASPGQGAAMSGHRHLCALREPLGVQEPEDPPNYLPSTVVLTSSPGAPHRPLEKSDCRRVCRAGLAFVPPGWSWSW